MTISFQFPTHRIAPMLLTEIKPWIYITDPRLQAAYYRYKINQMIQRPLAQSTHNTLSILLRAQMPDLQRVQNTFHSNVYAEY